MEQKTQAAITKKQENRLLNPLLLKLHRQENVTRDAATYGGIGGKVVFLMSMILLGILLARLQLSFTSIVVLEGQILWLPPWIVGLSIFCLLLLIVIPIVAFPIRRAMFLIAPLYTVAYGYLLTCAAATVPSFSPLILLFAAITTSVVGTLALRYAAGWKSAVKKPALILLTIAGTFLFTGLLVVIASVMPGFPNAVDLLKNNLVLSLLIMAAYTAIASLLLAADFEFTKSITAKQLSHKDEWYAAFSLTCSGLWLLLKLPISLLHRHRKAD